MKGVNDTFFMSYGEIILCGGFSVDCDGGGDKSVFVVVAVGSNECK